MNSPVISTDDEYQLKLYFSELRVATARAFELHSCGRIPEKLRTEIIKLLQVIENMRCEIWDSVGGRGEWHRLMHRLDGDSRMSEAAEIISKPPNHYSRNHQFQFTSVRRLFMKVDFFAGR